MSKIDTNTEKSGNCVCVGGNSNNKCNNCNIYNKRNNNNYIKLFHLSNIYIISVKIAVS